MSDPEKDGGKGGAKSAPDDDAALWESIARSVKPIARRNVIPEVAKRAPDPPKTPDQPSKPPRVPIDVSDLTIGGRRDSATRSSSLPSSSGLSHGDAPGVDRRTADRFRRGQLPIEATLDLHGHNQESAYQALTGFIQAHQAAGRRCVLVITGKGLKEDWSVGVLREALPQWLNHQSIRKLILAFSYAQPHHGGSGAVYLLLRRNRQS